jgi:hypothetical protein
MPKRRETQKEYELPEILATIATAAKKAREIVKSGNRPSVDLVKHGSALLGGIQSLASLNFQETIDQERQAVQVSTGELGDNLREYCRDKGLLLAGAFPDFIVNGVVYVKVSENSSVTVNGRTLSALPQAELFRNISAEIEDLSSKRKPLEIVIAAIWEAYQQIVREKGDGNGLSAKRASILELLPRIALARQTKRFLRNPTREEFASYSIHHLRADLFALMERDGQIEHNGQRLILEPTSAAEDGLFMYVPALQRCAFVGHALFVGAEHDNR